VLCGNAGLVLRVLFVLVFCHDSVVAMFLIFLAGIMNSSSEVQFQGSQLGRNEWSGRKLVNVPCRSYTPVQVAYTLRGVS